MRSTIEKVDRLLKSDTRSREIIGYTEREPISPLECLEIHKGKANVIEYL